MRATRSTTLGDLPFQIDTSARDFIGVRSALLRFVNNVTPAWTDLDPSDPGVLLLEAVAYAADVLNYSIDRAQNESYLNTAQEYTNISKILKLVDYTMSTGSGSTVPLCVITDREDVVVPAGTSIISGSFRFEILTDVILPNIGVHAPASVSSIISDQIGESVNINNNLIAYYGSTVIEDIGISNGAPYQVFDLKQTPVALTTESTITIVSGGQIYTLADNFIDAEADSTIFTYSLRDNGIISIRFGNGVNGAIPASGAVITAQYRIGTGGSSNSLGVNTLKTFSPSVDGVISVYNPVSPSGGKDAETISEARNNAPLSMRALDRAVTLQDYEILAVRNPSGGVSAARASSVDPYDVVVYISATGSNPIPTGTWYPRLDTGTGLIGSVGRWLTSRSVVGTSVDVRSPTPVVLNMNGVIRCLPNILRATVEQSVKDALLGMFLDTSSMFGRSLPVSRVIQIIENTRGVDYVDITAMHRQPALININGPLERTLSANLDITNIDTKCSARKYRIEWLNATQYKLYASDYGYIRSSYASKRPAIFTISTSYEIYFYPAVDTDDTAERDRQFTINLSIGLLPQKGDIWGFNTDFYLGNIDLEPSEIIVPPLVSNALDTQYINFRFLGGI